MRNLLTLLLLSAAPAQSLLSEPFDNLAGWTVTYYGPTGGASVESRRVSALDSEPNPALVIRTAVDYPVVTLERFVDTPNTPSQFWSVNFAMLRGQLAQDPVIRVTMVGSPAVGPMSLGRYSLAGAHPAGEVYRGSAQSYLGSRVGRIIIRVENLDPTGEVWLDNLMLFTGAERRAFPSATSLRPGEPYRVLLRDAESASPMVAAMSVARCSPLSVPGFTGSCHLDPGVLAVTFMGVPGHTTVSLIGSVPAMSSLAGLHLSLQAAQFGAAPFFGEALDVAVDGGEQ